MMSAGTNRTRNLVPGAVWWLGLLAWWGGAGVACAQTGARSSALSAGVSRGWRLFHAKHCVECHAIWGQGGRVGPDLGRTATRQQSGGQLAGVMWNHIPKMLGRMEQTGRRPTTLTRDEMGDLFALLVFARQLDDTGDARRGERILEAKGCTKCHSMGSLEEGIGPDLAKWGRYANPIAWAQMMWEHAPMMEEAMKRSGVVWPKLQGADIVDMLAYVRSVGGEGDREYLQPGSDQRGRRLFVEKGCSACHPGSGPDLATRKLPRTVGGLAVRMWNHAPIMASSMREQAITRRPVSAQELADLLAYVLELSRVDRTGDPNVGAVIFERKGCNQCHEAAETTNAVGPAVAELSRDAGPVDMAAAMWNHGGAMLERMTEAGVSWPVFDNDEMVDLLAFLKNGDRP